MSYEIDAMALCVVFDQITVTTVITTTTAQSQLRRNLLQNMNLETIVILEFAAKTSLTWTTKKTVTRQ